MENPAVPVTLPQQQEKDPTAGKLKRPAGSFSQPNVQKNALQSAPESDRIPLMVDYKEIRIKVTPEMHQVLAQCAAFTGYSTLTEFVRIAIQDKIRHDCSPHLISVEELVDTSKIETKKG
jgi:hypothetical protein